MPEFHVAFRNLLHAVNLRHGTDGFTSPPKERVLKIFFALKNPTDSAGFERANLGTNLGFNLVYTFRHSRPSDMDTAWTKNNEIVLKAVSQKAVISVNMVGKGRKC